MRSLNYTQYGIASAIDRHDLRRDAHFVGLSLLAIMGGMQVIPYLYQPLLQLLVRLGWISPTQGTSVVSFIGLTLLNAAFYLLQILLPVVAVTALCRRRINPFSEHRRLHPVSFAALVGIGMAACILANILSNYIVSFLSQYGIGSPDTTGGVEANPTSLLYGLLFTAVLPGLCEELIFRGYILQTLRRYGDGFAIVVSASLFALLHGNVQQIPFAFVVGLICGYVVVQTGNIWVAITIHTLNNSMAVLLNSFRRILTEPQNTVLNLVVPLVLVAIGVSCYLGLRGSESAYLDRPSGGWTSLRRREKWETLFSSPLFVAAVLTMGLLTLLTTMEYSAF